MTTTSTETSITLGDADYFAWSTGVWTGKTGPLTPIPVLRSANFTSEGGLVTSDVPTIEVERRHLPEKELSPDDIILERSGGGPKQPVGRVVLFDIPGRYSFGNFTARLRVLRRDVLLPRFVFYYLHFIYISGSTASLQQNTTGIRNLRFNDYKRLRIPLMPREVQHVVVELMDSLRRAIAVEDRRAECLRELLTTYSAEVFRRGMRNAACADSRLGLQPSDWSVEELGELARVSTGTTPSTDNATYYRGDVPFIKTGEIANNFIDAAAQHVSAAAVADCNLRIYPPSTVFMAMYGQGKTRGQVALLRIGAATTQNTGAIETGPRLRSGFLWLYLLTQYRQLRETGHLGHLSHLNLAFVRRVLIPLPSIEEQEEIERSLLKLYLRLQVAERRRASLRRLFENVLVELMTGRAMLSRD